MIGYIFSSPELSQVLLWACPSRQRTCLSPHSYATTLAGSCQTPPKHQTLMPRVFVNHHDWAYVTEIHLNILIFGLCVFQFCSKPVDLALRFLNLGKGNKQVASIQIKEIQMSTVGKDMNPSQVEIGKIHWFQDKSIHGGRKDIKISPTQRLISLRTMWIPMPAPCLSKTCRSILLGKQKPMSMRCIWMVQGP